MDANSDTLFAVLQAEHHIRLRDSQRLRDAEQAAGSQPARSSAPSILAWMSAALIAAGERLQAEITFQSAHTESIR